MNKNIVDNINDITNFFDVREWGEIENSAQISSVSLEISDIGSKAIKSTQGSTGIFRNSQSLAQYVLKMANLSDQHAKMLDEIIMGIKKQSLTLSDLELLGKQLVELDRKLRIMYLGINHILSKDLNIHLKNETDALMHSIHLKLSSIAEEIVKYLKSEKKTKLLFRSHHLGSFCTLRAPVVVIPLFLDQHKKSPLKVYNHLSPEQLDIVIKNYSLINSEFTIKNIKKFGILTNNQLFDILTFVAKNNPFIVISNIKNFDSLDKKKIVEIYQVAALHQPRKMIRLLKDFPLAPKEAYEILKICIKQEAVEELLRSLDAFSFLTNDQIIEILMLGALEDPHEIANNIPKFTFLNDETRFNICKACLKGSGRFLDYFKNFRIEDEMQRFELAIIGAKYQPASIADKMEVFRLSEKLMLEVIKLVIPGNVETIINNLDKFTIINPKTRVEITRLCAINDGNMTVIYLKKLAIKDPEALFDILMLCLLRSDTEVNSYQVIYLFQDFADEMKIDALKNMVDVEYLDAILSEEYDPNAFDDSAFSECKKFLGLYAEKNGLEHLFGKLIDNIMKIQNPQVKFQNISWLANTMILINAFKNFGRLSQESLQWLAAQELMNSIADFAKPAIRLQLSICAAQVASTHLGRDGFIHLNNKPLNQNKEKLKIAVWTKSKNILVPLLCTALINREDNDLFERLKSFAKELDKQGCFNEKEYSQILVETLIFIVQDENFTSDQKMLVLERMLTEKMDVNDKDSRQILKNLYAINSILFFKESIRLLDSSKTLVEISEEVFCEIFSCENIENFAFKYDKIFRSSRYPSAVLIYGSKIASIAYKEKDASLCFVKYLTSTLNETFLDERYEISNNIHLKKLDDYDKNLLESWRKNEAIKIESLLEKEISSKKWLDQILGQTIGNLNFDYCTKYLRESNPDNLSFIENKLMEEISENQREFKKDSGLFINVIKKCNSVIKLKSEIESLVAEKTNLSAENEQSIDKKIKRRELSIQDLLIQMEEQLKKLPKKYTANTSFPIALSSDKIKEALESLLESKKKFTQMETTLSELRMQLLAIQWVKACEEMEGILADRKKMTQNDAESMGTKSIIYNQKLDEAKKRLLEIKKIHSELPSQSDLFAKALDLKIEEMKWIHTLDSQSEYVLETDDPIDLLLCGTEMQGSCQHVNEGSFLNLGLLGYKMDGKIKMLAIKKQPDVLHPIIARAMLKLLWDGKRPVLLIDRLYPSNLSFKHAESLKKMALKRAKELGVPLVCVSDINYKHPYRSNKLYGKILYALGGPAPYEYSDASTDTVLKVDGKYEIENAYIVK